MKNRTLCIIFGGMSTEYEVSLRSVSTVLNHIDKEKYEIHIIGINKKGKWYLYKDKIILIEQNLWEMGEKEEVCLSINKGCFITEGGKEIMPDKVLIMTHGAYGEDGRIQGALDLAGIKYVGCGSFASSYCMDKEITKLIASSIGIKVADGFVIRREEYNPKTTFEKCKELGFPLFVKVACGGSSVGVIEVEKPSELKKAIGQLLNIYPKLIVEKRVVGTETEVAILEKNGEIIATGCGQIEYTGKFYTYFDKYTSQENKYIVPAKIDKGIEKTLLEMSKRLFYALGCKDLCRIDYFITEKGEIIFNEVNSIPGFTEQSMYPMIIKSQGILLSALIDALIL